MKERTPIILCADDFGLNSGISEGILRLVRKGRLSAVSCIVNSADFIVHARDLLSLREHVKIGLHFNLTEGYFLSSPEKRCFNLNELLFKTHLGLIRLPFIIQELVAQLDQFAEAMQCLPDFIDGHQHVHQFPIIRKAVLAIYRQKLQGKGIFIRSTWPTLNTSQSRFKTKILGLTGGKTLRKKLTQLGIPSNYYFSGIYDFMPNRNYREIFRMWLSLARENTLIMCHPGDSSSIDPIAPARLKELDYFLSDQFLYDCEEYHVHL